jgi:hypothetical protein
MTAVCAVLATATAQDTRSMPPVVLRIDTANFVRYDQDTTDWTGSLRLQVSRPRSHLQRLHLLLTSRSVTLWL